MQFISKFLHITNTDKNNITSINKVNNPIHISIRPLKYYLQMKIRLIYVIVFALLANSFIISAQGFKPPSEGKAVVYFTRVTDYGMAVSFEFFHNDKYIGIFKGKNYMRYELEPGEQLLWASSENKEFVTAELKAGGTYIIIVDVIMGAWKARVGFNPITADDERFERAKKLISSKPPVITPLSKIDDMNKKLADFIAEQLKKYNEDWKLTHNFKHISPEMAIPEEAMK